MYIFKAMKMQCVSFLPRLLPLLLQIARGPDATLRRGLLEQLALIVSVVRQHSRKYVGVLMGAVEEFWAPGSPLIPTLLELVLQLSLYAAGESTLPYAGVIVQDRPTLFVDCIQSSTV